MTRLSLEATVKTIKASLGARGGTPGARPSLSSDELTVAAGQMCLVDCLTGNEVLEIAEEAD